MSVGGAAMARAGALLDAKRYAEAAALAYQCAASWPDDPQPLVLAARAELGLARLDAAEAAARSAVERAPISTSAHQVLVAVLTDQTYASRGPSRRAGRAAITAARHLVRLAPTDVRSHWALTDACAAAHRGRQAVTSSDVALEMAPQASQTWLLRARAARVAGDLEVAESAIRECLRLEPEDYLANNELGIIFRHRGRTAEGLQQLASTASIAPLARPARANLVAYGAKRLQVLILLVTSPSLLILHSATPWLWGSFLVNAFVWRVKPTRSWLERKALALSLWRSRRRTRGSRRRGRLVPPTTPIQLYRNKRTVLILLLILLLWMSAAATAEAADRAPVCLPLCLLLDGPTAAFAWFTLARVRRRPGSRR